MNFRQSLSAVMALSVALAVSPARATDNHTYGKNEYAIIRDGLAPNRAMSLAAHGEGELGDENFHIWLMAEPAHRKIAPLDGISSDNNLDTGPNSYRAQWSADSRRVAVSFRSDRHVIQLKPVFGPEPPRGADPWAQPVPAGDGGRCRSAMGHAHERYRTHVEGR